MTLAEILGLPPFRVTPEEKHGQYLEALSSGIFDMIEAGVTVTCADWAHFTQVERKTWRDCVKQLAGDLKGIEAQLEAILDDTKGLGATIKEITK